MLIVIENIVIIGCWWLAEQYGSFSPSLIALASLVLALILTSALAFKSVHTSFNPFKPSGKPFCT